MAALRIDEPKATMIRKLVFVVFLLAMFSVCLPHAHAVTTCDIENIIGGKFSPGAYKMTVQKMPLKRLPEGLYKVVDQNIHIKTTPGCSGGSSNRPENVVLEIHFSGKDSVTGKIHFID